MSAVASPSVTSSPSSAGGDERMPPAWDQLTLVLFPPSWPTLGVGEERLRWVEPGDLPAPAPAP